MSQEPAELMEVDEHPPSDHDAQSAVSASEESDGEPEAPVDLMVVSRARRSNAGNRMATLIAKSAEEEEWGEEWEEAPNEEEFVGDDANNHDDFNLESSSSEDEDDDAEDEAGEKELRKVERQERIRKRKPATNPFAARLAAASRKRVKLDVPSTDAQSSLPPRPKKKSERASWIPTEDDGPLRTSSRRQTMANKEHTMAKLKAKDRRRDDTLAMMKAAEARKAKDEPKLMTQAERLTEAARNERVNSKSLHRWEEAEELRAAERQAKLDALKNRQIDGPFIRYYSGPAIWVDEKIKYTGKSAPKIEDLEEKYNKDIHLLGETSDSQPPGAVDQTTSPIAGRTEDGTSIVHPPEPPQWPQSIPDVQPPEPSAASQLASEIQDPPIPQPTPHIQQQASQPPPPSNPPTATIQAQPKTSHEESNPSSLPVLPPRNSPSLLSGIEQYVNEQQETPIQQTPVQSQPPETPNLQEQQTPSHTTTQLPQDFTTPQMSPNPFSQHSTMQPPSSIPPNPFTNYTPLGGHSQLNPQPNQTQQTPEDLLQQSQHPPPPPAPPRRKQIRLALRNLLILSSFPNLSATAPISNRPRTTTSLAKEKDRTALIQLSTTLFNWTQAEATSFVTSMLNAPKTKKEREALASRAKREVCAVTNLPARYRDPGTGIAYRDQKAFSVIRGVVGGGFVWSGRLGCFVGGRVSEGEDKSKRGRGAEPVKGVPKRFLSMSAEAAEKKAATVVVIDAEKAPGSESTEQVAPNATATATVTPAPSSTAADGGGGVKVEDKTPA